MRFCWCWRSLRWHSVGVELSHRSRKQSQSRSVERGCGNHHDRVVRLGLIETSNVKESPLSQQLSKSDLHGWTLGQALIILVLTTLGVLWLSETLVGATQTVVASSGVSEFFLGIILVPIIGNVAEHLVSVQLALKNKIELSVEVATSSSLQIALFVAPLLVFISLLLGHPLQLIFNRFELMAVLTAVVVSALVSSDGESTWLEGAGLLAVYLILGLGFFLLP